MTRAEQVYQQLKDRLLRGVWAQGKRLIEKELTELLSVSRTPLRSALIRLEEEGLLTSRPYRGYAVVEIDTTTLGELHDLREDLEFRAAMLAAARRTAGDLAAMDALLRRLKRLAPEARWDEEVRLGIGVHRLVARASQHPFLRETLDRLYDRISLAAWVDASFANDIVRAREEHQAIVDAIRRRDRRRLARVIRQHASRSKLNSLRVASARRGFL